ncbi:MAG: hypothetical protein ACYDBT_08690 [Desulfobulbaceae bacterium]
MGLSAAPCVFVSSPAASSDTGTAHNITSQMISTPGSTKVILISPPQKKIQPLCPDKPSSEKIVEKQEEKRLKYTRKMGEQQEAIRRQEHPALQCRPSGEILPAPAPDQDYCKISRSLCINRDGVMGFWLNSEVQLSL